MATASKKTTGAAAGKSAAALGVPSMAEMTKMLKEFKLPGVDVKALVEWQRKDMEALAEANRQAYAGMKALAERRAEILRENLASLQESMKSSMGADALTKQSEAVKKGMKKVTDDFRELAAMEAKSRTDAWKVVQQRMQDNMAQFKGLMGGKK